MEGTLWLQRLYWGCASLFVCAERQADGVGLEAGLCKYVITVMAA